MPPLSHPDFSLTVTGTDGTQSTGSGGGSTRSKHHMGGSRSSSKGTQASTCSRHTPPKDPYLALRFLGDFDRQSNYGSGHQPPCEYYRHALRSCGGSGVPKRESNYGPELSPPADGRSTSPENSARAQSSVEPLPGIMLPVFTPDEHKVEERNIVIEGSPEQVDTMDPFNNTRKLCIDGEASVHRNEGNDPDLWLEKALEQDARNLPHQSHNVGYQKRS